jgi:hypothetical protein
MDIVTAILALIQLAPAAITEITAVYNAVKGDLSETDQGMIDRALLLAQQNDAAATAAADAALDAASKR